MSFKNSLKYDIIIKKKNYFWVTTTILFHLRKFWCGGVRWCCNSFEIFIPIHFPLSTSLSLAFNSFLILFFFFRKIEPAAFEDITHICPLYSFFYEWTILEGSSRLLKKRVSGIEYNATLLQTSIPKGYILWAQSFSYLVTDKVNFSKIYYYFILLFSYR